MNRILRYLSIFCCTLLLIIFFSQIGSSTLAQVVSNNSKIGTAIAISPDAKTLAVGVKDGRVVLLDAASGKEKLTLTGHEGLPVTKVVFNPKGDKVASVGRDSVLRESDVNNGKQLKSLTGHENPTRTVAYSPDGQTLASGGEDTRIVLWNEESGKLLRILEGNFDFVNDVAFSPDGKTLASGSEDARIILWDVATGKQRLTLLGHADAVTEVAFSPKGDLLASASNDSTVRLWNVANGTQRQVFREPTKKVTTVAFSPDGKTLFGAGDDNQVFQWDVETAKLRSTLKGNTTSITGLAISADGSTLVSADREGAIILWDVPKGQQKQSTQVLSTQNVLTTPQQSLTTQKTAVTAVPSPPGGPILVIVSTSNPFNNYYAEILRNEGLNAFGVSDISSVTSATLNNYDLVILADMTLTSAQVTILSNWVNSGGNLIAMHPDKQLANLLGLTDAGSTLSNGYLLVDTSKAPGNGIVNQTIQFHGTADRYTLSSASSLATLYTNATTATPNPAVTLRSVGSGGQAAAFTYDLARSIIYTRQGDPAWAAQERDGLSPIRSDDKFFGNATGDPEPDWVDLNNVAIPQADEQQRLLANLIINMNLAKKPLPRFWYFPNGKKAVVLMTGDDHGHGGTAGRFDQFSSQSPAGCSVDNWECIRGTSYIYPDTPIANSQVATYNANGFEISLHVNTNCADYTPTSLESFYSVQLSAFSTNFPSIPAPVTERQHCLVWSDWLTGAKVELNHGIRLDTSYYYWPPNWVADSPGFFTGSGMPMRLADLDGTLIDVYGANTQMTDESGQLYPFTIDTLLDRALGSEGYYGVFTVNAHTDYNPSAVSDAVVPAATSRGVPIVSARQMLTWLDGRNTSSFGSLSWNNSSLSFTIAPGTGANGLQAMLPTNYANRTLTSITRNGSSVTYTTSAIKGIDYAFFSGSAGSYVATYASDTTPPTVSSTTPTNGATNVSIGTNVTATFSEDINAATVNTNTFELRNSANAVVSATVTYNATTKTATLRPNASLPGNTTYTATIKGGTTDPRIKDQAGNALAANVSWSFTTGATPCSQQPCSIWNNSATPTNPSVSDSNAAELGVKFRSDVNGFIRGIRFYKGTANTGTHVGTLWSSSGQQLAQATFTNETASGWQQVNFATPVTITANTVYVASYHTNVGNYAGDNNFFATSGINNAPLHALVDGNSGSNGVYLYSTGGFPTNTYQSTNYWVDIVFTTN